VGGQAYDRFGQGNLWARLARSARMPLLLAGLMRPPLQEDLQALCRWQATSGEYSWTA
jgi:hypothetical protein